jgi:hypothetical protein
MGAVILFSPRGRSGVRDPLALDYRAASESDCPGRTFNFI